MHVRTLIENMSRSRIRASLRIIRILGLCRRRTFGGSLVTSSGLLLEFLEALLPFFRRSVNELLFQTQDTGLYS